MTSFHYMREIQKDNERRIERANKIKRYYSQEKQAEPEMPAYPGVFMRLLNSTGNLLINLGTRLQALSA